jgi:hypothetical protein
MALSVNGVPIRLTEERWFHIGKHHPELRRLRRLVLHTVAQPEHLFFWPRTGDLAAVAEFSELVKLGLSANLVVHYRESSDRGGFIVTAFPMSRRRIQRRFSRWQRLK